MRAGRRRPLHHIDTSDSSCAAQCICGSEKNAIRSRKTEMAINLLASAWTENGRKRFFRAWLGRLRAFPPRPRKAALFDQSGCTQSAISRLILRGGTEFEAPSAALLFPFTTPELGEWCRRRRRNSPVSSPIERSSPWKRITPLSLKRRWKIGPRRGLGGFDLLAFSESRARYTVWG